MVVPTFLTGDNTGKEDNQMRRTADANRKKFVRYKEGAELYSMCQSKFERMAKEAKAIYKVDKVVLVNCDIFEEYLETFRLEC